MKEIAAGDENSILLKGRAGTHVDGRRSHFYHETFKTLPMLLVYEGVGEQVRIQVVYSGESDLVVDWATGCFRVLRDYVTPIGRELAGDD